MEKSYKKPVCSNRNKIKEIEKSCEDSLNEILRSAIEVTEISKKAEEELEQQTEQIKHINDETDIIKDKLNQSQYHLEGIKCWWKSINSYLGLEAFNNNENKQTNNSDTNYAKKGRVHLNNKNTIVKNYNKIYKNTKNLKENQSEKKSFDEKYESELNTLSSILDELHDRALVMGNTINEQNKLLTGVNEKMEHNIEKIQDQQNLMKEIMKK
ncbi:SNARE protein, putative [Hepatocystis sp. ex Piliocolobus tephrosceles]|nr:SNARE protein, putative [Hepatocystis sp. ex Piliocolobus tephrosceles]